MTETEALEAVQATIQNDRKLSVIFGCIPEFVYLASQYLALGVVQTSDEALDYVFRHALTQQDMSYRERAERKFGIHIPAPDAVSPKDAKMIDSLMEHLPLLGPVRLGVTKTDYDTAFDIKSEYDIKRKRVRSDNNIGEYTAMLVFDNETRVEGKMPDTVVGLVALPIPREQEHDYALEFLDKYKAVESVVFVDVFGTVHANHHRIARIA